VPLRLCSLFVLAALALTAASATAAPRAATGASPSLVHRGQKMTISSATPSSSACAALIRFSDGRFQQLPMRRPKNRVVTFVVTIPKTASVGAGKWSVICGASVKAGTFVVVGVKSTTAADMPRVVVDKQGFSQRPDRGGTGSQLSYGLLLHNTSTTEDAQNVYVIVNMVTATGELIGSKSRTVPLVPAGDTYALGDMLTLRTQVAATSLEITIRVGAHQPKQKHAMPDFANVRILPSTYDPGWVSEVDGEIVNDTSPLTLTSANLSIVILDASGNPIGGGLGYTTAALPSGSRFVFLAQLGFSSIPLDRAAMALISVEPAYTAAT
jgi:hypothetical protein